MDARGGVPAAGKHQYASSATNCNCSLVLPLLTSALLVAGWAASDTNSNPGFCLAGWTDLKPGPNASLLVFKAGPQGSEPPCGNFLGVAAASSDDLTERSSGRSSQLVPVKAINTAHNFSEDAFLFWRDERRNYHLLYHSYGQGGVSNGVGSHAFAKHSEGPWYDSQEPVYTTAVANCNIRPIFRGY